MKIQDPYSLFVWLSALLVGSKTAGSLGPYLLLIICTTATAYVALGRQGPDEKIKGFKFIAIVNVISLAVTGIIASAVANYVGFIEETAVFAPVALFVGFVGLDWPKVIPIAWGYWVKWRSGGKDAN